MLLRPESIAFEKDSLESLELAEPTTPGREDVTCPVASMGPAVPAVSAVSAVPTVPVEDWVPRRWPTECMKADEGLRQPNWTTSTSFKFWLVINSTVESKTGDVKSSVMRCGAWICNEEDLLWVAGGKPRQ